MKEGDIIVARKFSIIHFILRSTIDANYHYDGYDKEIFQDLQAVCIYP